MSTLLPEPGETVPLEDLYFSVEASLVRRLGTESVSDKVLSVMELIKNSYDADATKVTIIFQNMRTGKSKIEISDNGSGMMLDDLMKKWMRIATPWKRRKRITPKYKRKMLGLKGIGRFAVENLSAKTTVTSYPEDKKEGFRIMFNWDEYSSPNAELSSIANKSERFTKKPDLHGFKISLEKLNHRWQERDVEKLRQYIRSLIPPYRKEAKFRVKIETDEFADLAGVVDSNFLSKAIFKFEAILDKKGNIEYRLRKRGSKRPKTRKAKFKDDFACGPLNFILYFYYREKNKMAGYGIRVPEIKTFRKLLDDYGNIRIYRDGIRISGFGNPDDDWVGLDALSRNDPSVIPARGQIISAINISSDKNPEITDTTTRENIIKNRSFQDMLEFIRISIAVFAQMRGEVEGKRKKVKKKASKYVEKARENLRKRVDKPPLLDFGKDYPLVFYEKLEEEIDLCFAGSLPNATLILCRKVVENLLYNIHENKFPREVKLRYRIDQGRAQDFSVLLQYLEARIHDFDREQRDLIKKLLQLIKPFRREANSTVHKVLEYVDDIDDLDALKIPEIVQIELELIRKIKEEKRGKS